MAKALRIGRLPPKYTFILNPYTDARFTRCCVELPFYSLLC